MLKKQPEPYSRLPIFHTKTYSASSTALDWWDDQTGQTANQYTVYTTGTASGDYKQGTNCIWSNNNSIAFDTPKAVSLEEISKFLKSDQDKKLQEANAKIEELETVVWELAHQVARLLNRDPIDVLPHG